MLTMLFVHPRDVDNIRSNLALFDDVAEVDAETRHQLDAMDIVGFAIEYTQPQNLMLLCAFLLGQQTRFKIEHDGFSIEVRNLKMLAKIWKALKSHDGE